jgi:hypothetical protein
MLPLESPHLLHQGQGGSRQSMPMPSCCKHTHFLALSPNVWRCCMLCTQLLNSVTQSMLLHGQLQLH